jgi:hypothetical protein
MIERRFQGMAMEAAVVAVYEQKRANVAELDNLTALFIAMA